MARSPLVLFMVHLLWTGVSAGLSGTQCTCSFHPCQSFTCPNVREAHCRLSSTQCCTAEFTLNGKVVTERCGVSPVVIHKAPTPPSAQSMPMAMPLQMTMPMQMSMPMQMPMPMPMPMPISQPYYKPIPIPVPHPMPLFPPVQPFPIIPFPKVPIASTLPIGGVFPVKPLSLGFLGGSLVSGFGTGSLLIGGGLQGNGGWGGWGGRSRGKWVGRSRPIKRYRYVDKKKD